MNFSRQIFAFIAAAALLSACGKYNMTKGMNRLLNASKKDRPGTGHQNRPPVPLSFSSLDTDPQQGSASIPSYTQPLSACVYWQQLPSSAPAALVGSFQFFERMEKSSDGSIAAAFNLITLPQARFGFSKEANHGESPLPDVWTFNNFYVYATTKIAQARAALVKRLNESTNEAERQALNQQIKDLDDKKSKLDMALKYPWIPIVRPRDKALVSRNDSIVADIESKLPGVVTGNAGRLTQSPFYQGLVKALGGTAPSAQFLMVRKAYLMKKVPLFVSDDWTLRRLDMQQALTSLRTTEEGNVIPETPDEMLCRYLVSQRLMAQLINLKGVEGSPVITSYGRLAPLPSTWDQAPVFANLAGTAYASTTVNERWIGEQMAKAGDQMPRMNGTTSEEQFLEATRFWVAVTSHRYYGTWQTGAEAADGRLNVNPALLKLGFGMLGLHLSILKTTEFAVKAPEVRGPENGYVQLREDLPDNLARLILLTRETLRGLRDLRNPDDFGNLLLSPAQVALFVTPQVGVLDQFGQLLTAASLEGMIRLRNHRGSPALEDVYQH